MSKLLINEPPLQVLPSLAVAIGLNEAMLLQQLHYWMQRSNIEHDGRQWVYNTMEDWQKQLPFWSVATIKRAFNVLRELGIVDSEQLSADKRDKTNYYTINYNALDDLPMRSICTDGEGQIDTMQEVSLSRCYIRTETTTEKENTAPIGAPAKNKTKTVSKPEKPKSEESEAEFEKFWQVWPKSDRKQAKGLCLKVWKKAGAERHAADILAHIEACKRSENWSKEGGQFIPAPLVYLNQKRWEGAELAESVAAGESKFGSGFEGVM